MPCVSASGLPFVVRDSMGRFFATEFTPLWLGDARNIIHHFVCDLAERELMRERESGNEPAPLWWRALAEKRRLIDGGITASDYRSVWDAAVTSFHVERRQYGYSPSHALVFKAITSSIVSTSQIKVAIDLAMDQSGLDLKAAVLDDELERRITDAFAPR